MPTPPAVPPDETARPDVPAVTFAPKSLGAGRYLLGRLLGEGGMATVYEAYDVRLKQWRAVKLLNTQVARSAAISARFELEASALASIDHPGIIRIFDVGSEEGQPYLVMELADGGSADDWIERHGRMPPRVAVDVAIQIARGLEVVHRAGIVHRDVKPANILFTGGNIAKLADFGIVLAADGQSRRQTRTGVGMGTIGFMAPEQRADAHAVSRVADVYALGSTLYAMVTGRFSVDLFAHSLHPGTFDEVPESLVPIIKRAVAYMAADRTASATLFAEELSEIGDLPPLPESMPPLVAETRATRVAPIPGSDPTWSDSEILPPKRAPLPTMVPDGLGVVTAPDSGTFPSATADASPTRNQRRWVLLGASLLTIGLALVSYSFGTHQIEQEETPKAVSAPEAAVHAVGSPATSVVAASPPMSAEIPVVEPVVSPPVEAKANAQPSPLPTAAGGRVPAAVLGSTKPKAGVPAPSPETTLQPIESEAVPATDEPPPETVAAPPAPSFAVQLTDLRAGPAGSSVVLSFETSGPVRPVHFLVEGGDGGTPEYRVRLSGVSSRSLGLSELSIAAAVATGVSVKESPRGTEISVMLTTSQIAPVKLDVKGNRFTLTISPKAP